MPQVINTNISSLIAQQNLNKSQQQQNQALERLSSGLRINSAADDAAGYAISNRFDAQISGTNVAVRNSNDGISLAQTAGGALNNIKDNLQRIRDLALQSANASNTSVDRKALQAEVSQLKGEIGSIASKSNFNGKNLLDGSFGSATFQTGANVGDTTSVTIAGARTDQLGTAQTNGVSSAVLGTAKALAAGDLVINGVAVGASTAAADGASTGSADQSAIAKVAAINAVSDQSGVTATVNTNTVEGTDVSSTGISSGSFTLNGVTINVGGSGVAANLKTDFQQEVKAINAHSGETGVTASFNANNLKAGVQLNAADGRNIVLAGGSSFGLAADKTYTGTYTLNSKDGSDITVSSTTGNSLKDAGLQVGSYSGSNSVATGDAVSGALSAGDLVINGVSVGATQSTDDTASTANKDQSAISVAAAINRVSDQSGVTAQVNSTQVLSNTISSAASGNVTINNVAISFAAASSATAQVGTIVDAINAKSAQTGVTAEAVTGGTYQLLASDGRNIDVGTTSNAGLTANTNNYGSVSLVGGGPIEVSSNTAAGPDKSGLKAGTYGGGESGELIKNVDVSTVAGANKAITAVDNAINQVSSQAANLGAIQNRFQATISNLQTTSTNLTAANSQIKDADFAKETAALSKAQVLRQAGISILAQANAQPRQVLSLLQ